MGLDNTAAQVLSGARAIGADFKSTMMVGRQWLLANPTLVDEIARVHGVQAPPRDPADRFAEPFFRMLGARNIDSIDYSDYESASIVHDLNQPLPPELRAQYDVVFDGGTLEHVFNFPTALKSCLEMVRVGGLFVQVSNANNFMGHGFWQISPELMYRSLSEANGFEVVTVMLRELREATPHGRLHAPFRLAKDTNKLGWRVELVNRRPTYIITIARRVSDVPIFASPPQQSDYERYWETGQPAVSGGSGPTLRTRLIAGIRKLVPAEVERSIRPPFANKAYQRVTADAVMRGRFPRQ